MTDKQYTNYENEEITNLMHISHYKHPPPTHDLKPVTQDFMKILYYDSRMNHIYDKKTIAIGSLNKLYKDSSNSHRKHQLIIDAEELHIDAIIYNEDYKKEKTIKRSSELYCIDYRSSYQSFCIIQ